jgi:hypothetical protein
MLETGKILYFDAPGPQNTDHVVVIVKERVEKGEIPHVIVCSITGKTALKIADAVKDFGIHVCCVTGTASWQIHGYKWPLIRGSIRKKLEELKVDIVERTPSTLSGDTIDYGLARYGWVPASWIVAETLEAIGGYGLKTAVEGVLVATDSGAVPPYVNVVSVAGTGSGADTAITAKSTFSACMFSRDTYKRFQILEILAMPKNKEWHKAIDAGEFHVKETT